MADCPVCGVVVTDDDSSNFRWFHSDGKWYRFEDIGCRNKFIGNPEKYLDPEAAEATS